MFNQKKTLIENNKQFLKNVKVISTMKRSGTNLVGSFSGSLTELSASIFSSLKDLRGGGGGSFFRGTDAKPRFEGFED